jgi:hypothetical protein
MNKCVKLFALALVLLSFSACKKDAPESCYTYKDCLGNTLSTICNQTESDAQAYAAAHSSTTCHWSYVRN